MELRVGTLLIGMILSLLAIMSALNAHTFGIHLDYPFDKAILIIGMAAFSVALILRTTKPSYPTLISIWLPPLLCASAFSWGEILTEFDPRNGSKGFGYLWLMGSCVFSMIGFAFGFLVMWIQRRIFSEND